MKLLTLKPFIFEADEEDIFANRALPTDPTELLATLERKEGALERQKRDLDGVADDIARGAWGVHGRYLYGSSDAKQQQIETDLLSGKSIQIGRCLVVPNVARNQAIIKKAMDKLRRYEQIDLAYKKIHSRVVKVKKEVTAIHQATLQSAKTASKQIPESKVPEKLSVGKSTFNNPYFLSALGRYAGDPAFYSWTSQMLPVYHQLDRILTSRGLDGFTVMYASTLDLGKTGYVKNMHNFAVIGASGKLIWRKHDTSGMGSGFNSVYMNNRKVPISTILWNEKENPSENDALFTQLKP